MGPPIKMSAAMVNPMPNPPMDGARLSTAVPKIQQLRDGFAGDIAVDGGINERTGRECRKAGANVFVAGTYVFRAASYQDAMDALRSDE